MEIVDFLTKQGASWGETPGERKCVLSFSDLETELKAMETNAIAYRGERDTVIGLGDDFIPLIQGLVTGDVFALAEAGTGMQTCAVNINGRLVFDIRALHIDDMILLDFEPGVVSAGLLSHFKKNIINEDARFIDRSNGVVKVLMSGRDAISSLSALTSLDSELESLEMFNGVAGRFHNDDIVVQRVDFGSLKAFEVLLDKESFIPFFEEAVSKGSVPIGEKCQEWTRIQNGVPRFSVDPEKSVYGVELSSAVIPLEADLQDWISFEKGCYLGQEIIARLDSRGEPAKKLRRFELNKEAQIGDSILSEGKKVGELVSRQPLMDGRSTATGYVKRKFNDIGQVVNIASTVEQSCKVTKF